MESVQNEFGMRNQDQDCMDSVDFEDFSNQDLNDDVCFINEFDDLVFEDDILLF